MRKKLTNGYMVLISKLADYPEFDGIEDNPCDEEVIALGTALWEKWEAGESADVAELPDWIPPTTIEELDLPEGMPAQEISAIALMLRQESRDTVVRKTGISIAKYQSFMYYYGLPSPSRKANISHEITAESLLEATKYFNSLKEMSNHFHCTAQVVRYYLKKYKISFKPAKILKYDFSTEEILEVFEELGSVRETAEYFAMPPATVRYRLTTIGVFPRRASNAA